MTNKSKSLSCTIQNLHLGGFKVSNAGEEAAFNQVVEELNRKITQANGGKPIKLFDDSGIRTVIAIAISLLVEKTFSPENIDSRLEKLIADCDDTLA